MREKIRMWEFTKHGTLKGVVGWVSNIKFHYNDSRVCIMYCYESDVGEYQGVVFFRGLLDKTEKTKKTRWYKTPVTAVLKAEKLAEEMVAAENLPSWVDEALRLGFRPPVSK